MRFESRADAGRRLAAALSAYAGRKPIVLALPRGGVPVAAVVAAALNAPLDLVLVRKIGTPGQPELALGAIVDGANPMIVRNKRILASTGTSAAAFDAICQREMAEIERRRALYLGRQEPLDVTGRVVIVVDDGIATGATMRAALRATRRRGPARLVLAVPVASPDTLESLRPEVDETICLTNPEGFLGVGQFYDDFRQVTDDEVVALVAPVPGESSPTRR
ncbi:MAG: phosphoribosyltransferase [Alphaproteobacteria bacterium RIFCSPHIGHO2_12_FULL_66_14]|jgi:predicted phosphoribosyltransferase|nr:MAG: phosphoribosyltransferase [Alphaproteobacteria bacterium RIFCSPHIGHO2_12_FULL_66_14]